MPTQTKLRTYPLQSSPLFALKSRSKLASLLGITNGALRPLTKDPNSLYTESVRPKKSSEGTRLIENPAQPLKLTQAGLARLLGRIHPPHYLFCPVKGRCYVRNAARHRGNRVVHCLDVRKYFPSTQSRRVFWFFRSVMRCDRDISGALTALSCYKKHLPTGSPLSPIMAYFAHIDVWEAIARICNENGYTLTVYIDDVTISGPRISPEIMWQIKRCIHRVGLRYHKEKVFRDCPAEITGVIVDGGRLLPPHRSLKRAKSFRIELGKSKTAVDRRRAEEKLNGIRGQLAQIRQVAEDEPRLGKTPGPESVSTDDRPRL